MRLRKRPNDLSASEAARLSEYLKVIKSLRVLWKCQEQIYIPDEYSSGGKGRHFPRPLWKLRSHGSRRLTSWPTDRVLTRGEGCLKRELSPCFRVLVGATQSKPSHPFPILHIYPGWTNGDAHSDILKARLKKGPHKETGQFLTIQLFKGATGETLPSKAEGRGNGVSKTTLNWYKSLWSQVLD